MPLCACAFYFNNRSCCARFFNPVQSECYDAAYCSDVNMVVAAPTGCGKTGVMELAILRLLSRKIDNAGQLLPRNGASKGGLVG